MAERRPRLIARAPYVVLDTDVFSVAQRGQLATRLSKGLVGRTPCVTAITVGEVHQGAESAGWGPQRRARLADRLRALEVLPIDAEVAAVWGQISGRARLRGRPRPVNDVWIAACCLSFGVPLATLNRIDFADFATHEGLVLFDG